MSGSPGAVGWRQAGGTRARAVRIPYPGAVYHLMARGRWGRGVLRDNQDRKAFLSSLARQAQKRVGRYLGGERGAVGAVTQGRAEKVALARRVRQRTAAKRKKMGQASTLDSAEPPPFLNLDLLHERANLIPLTPFPEHWMRRANKPRLT